MSLKKPLCSLQTRITLLICFTSILSLGVTGALVISRLKARTRVVADALTSMQPPDGRKAGARALVIPAADINRTAVTIQRLIYAGLALGFAAGALGAMGVARSVKRTLFGMEPEDIAVRLQERNALLASVREGIVAVDRDLRITVVNEEAARLFRAAGLRDDILGLSAGEVLPDLGLRETLETGAAFDESRTLGGLRILTNRVPMEVKGERIGAVATFRDRTEIGRMAEELTGVRLYAEALRAQTHEFANKLHVILGLIRLGELERLEAFITETSGRMDDEVGYVLQRVKEPVLAGFVMARFSAAREQNITMHLTEDSQVPPCPDPQVIHAVVTILGNFLENAVEAIGNSARREIALSMVQEADWLLVTVEDSGPGLPDGDVEQLWARGFSTKGDRRGFGLGHARQAVEALGGRISAGNRSPHGAVFSASIPYATEEDLA